MIPFAGHTRALSQFDGKSEYCLTSLTVMSDVSREHRREKGNECRVLGELWPLGHNPFLAHSFVRITANHLVF